MGIETGLIALGTAIGAKDLIVKMFGPTAEYFGKEFAEFNQKRLENLRNIFKKTEKKLGEQINKPEIIPPVVLKEIIDNGSLYDENIFTEYYSGVLASSRTEEGKDDRGKTFSQTIHRLSSYQLRAHYILYSLFKEKYDGLVNCSLLTTMENMRIGMNSSDFNKSLGLTYKDDKNSYVIISHILSGLQREFLINPNWSIVTTNNSSYKFSVSPEINGYELFLWAQGKGSLPPSSFTSTDFNFIKIDGIILPSIFK